MAIVQPGFGFLCETDGGNILLEDPWGNTTEICEIYLFAYVKLGVEMGKNDIEYTKVYQMAILAVCDSIFRSTRCHYVYLFGLQVDMNFLLCLQILNDEIYYW